ncbi:MAG: sigma-70 family RNA polymerase sigma factor [Candidatus Methylomirabilales bacterium]
MEDHQLVERSRAGDVAAFEELVRRHQSRAYGIAYRLLGNREDAQEVAQEAFARAYFRLAEFRGTAQFRTWLYRILVNLATDLLRRRRPQVREEDVVLRPVTNGENPGKHLDQQELRQCIQKAIETLPTDLRTVILLRELEGLSYAEIARVIRRPVGTVMSRLFHARRRLQQSLALFWQGESIRD